MFCLKMLRRLKRTEDGVTAIEYGLIASLIAVMIVTAVAMAGTELTRTFDTIAAAFPSSAEDDSNNFPDPCEKGGTNCGNGN